MLNILSMSIEPAWYARGVSGSFANFTCRSHMRPELVRLSGEVASLGKLALFTPTLVSCVPLSSLAPVFMSSFFTTWSWADHMATTSESTTIASNIFYNKQLFPQFNNIGLRNWLGWISLWYRRLWSQMWWLMRYRGMIQIYNLGTTVAGMDCFDSNNSWGCCLLGLKCGAEFSQWRHLRVGDQFLMESSRPFHCWQNSSLHLGGGWTCRCMLIVHIVSWSTGKMIKVVNHCSCGSVGRCHHVPRLLVLLLLLLLRVVRKMTRNKIRIFTHDRNNMISVFS